jgi:hypothetical protein
VEDPRGGAQAVDASLAAITLATICTKAQLEETERKALELEKSRGADDQVDQMSQALNRLRAMVSLPTYSPPMPRPPTGDRGWIA